MSIGTVPYQPFPTVGYAMNAAGNGKMSLPVSPGMVIYSHFKNVSGTPAPEGTTGVNISRLKILDTLIEQLKTMKKQPSVMMNTEDMGVINQNDEQRINALIDQYQKQIRATQAASVYTPAAPVTGMLFSISV
ncbi:MAG: hypothetical protein FWC03_02280 [Treponema sp.]|nr:hypothetical protein [Treponema sp.]